jgi:hypothetical protein
VYNHCNLRKIIHIFFSLALLLLLNLSINAQKESTTILSSSITLETTTTKSSDNQTIKTTAISHTKTVDIQNDFPHPGKPAWLHIEPSGPPFGN